MIRGIFRISTTLILIPIIILIFILKWIIYVLNDALNYNRL